MSLTRGICNDPNGSSRERGGTRIREQQTATVHWQILGGNNTAQISGADPLPAKVNYFLGNDPAGWQTGLPVFSKVQVRNIYPGVDLVYYGNQRQLEYDFVVVPGADPRVISLQVTGADQVRIDSDGDLLLQVGANQLRQHKPVVYQMIGGSRRAIGGEYRLSAQRIITFEIGAFDHRYPLVIDPVLSYSTFIGGTHDDLGWDIALDGHGHV